MRRSKQKRQKRASARELFEQCARELQALNRRYESLFKFVHDPQTYAPHGLTREVIEAVIEHDMQAGDVLTVPIPLKFEVRR